MGGRLFQRRAELLHTPSLHRSSVLEKVFDVACDAFGSEVSLSVVKVEAHRSLADSNENPDIIYKWGGNKLADSEAKQGVALHPVCAQRVERHKVATQTVRKAAQFVTRALVWRLAFIAKLRLQTLRLYNVLGCIADRGATDTARYSRQAL